jgi:hypothetical protein
MTTPRSFSPIPAGPAKASPTTPSPNPTDTYSAYRDDPFRVQLVEGQLARHGLALKFVEPFFYDLLDAETGLPVWSRSKGLHATRCAIAVLEWAAQQRAKGGAR